MATEKNEENKASGSSTHEEILALARERFRISESSESELRRLALEDIKFSIGEQWPEDIRRQRATESRPCLTINRLPQTIHQITNDQRQNRPAIKVSPVDDKADIETAKIYQGLIRHIEYSSDADTAYDVAFDSAVRGGFGFFRIITEYCDPYSFDLDIRIKEVRNRFAARLDPNYQKIDGSDAIWGTVFTNLTDEEFKSKYPDAELSKMTDWGSIGDIYTGWIEKNQCRVAEYFTKTFKKIKLYQLENGQVLKKEDYEKILKESPQLLEGVQVSNERESVEPAIKWYVHNGLEILEETDWPGQWIPIIPVHGDMIDVEGVRILEGVVRHAKDPQRTYNYMITSETEAIALAPKAPWIGAEGSFEGHESKWLTANTKNHPYLEYKTTTLSNGQPAPAPQRLVFEPAVQAISQARLLASEDLKVTTGVYDAALGNRSNENSGIAIQRRANQAQTSNFHFTDNLSKSLRHAGRICVDLIPKIYDAPRTIRMLGEDDKEEIIKINQEFDRKGELKNYDLSVGKYDVTVSTGPSYQTKRQESAAALLELSTKVPQLMQVAPDLLVKALDIPDAEALAERFKKMLPPGIADDDENKKQIPPQVQAQMQQMNQMIEQLTTQLNEANKAIDTKTIEIESKERIEFAKMDVDLKKEFAKIDAKASETLFLQEIAQINKRLELLHMGQPIEQENQPTAGQTPMPAPLANMNQQPTGGQSPGQPMGV